MFYIQNIKTNEYLNSISQVHHALDVQTYKLEFSCMVQRFHKFELSSMLCYIYNAYRVEQNVKQHKFRVYRNSASRTVDAIKNCQIFIEGLDAKYEDLKIVLRPCIEEIKKSQIIRHLSKDFSGDCINEIANLYLKQRNDTRKKIVAWVEVNGISFNDSFNRITDLGIKFNNPDHDFYTFKTEEDLNLLRLAESDMMRDSSLVMVEDLDKVVTEVEENLKKAKFFKDLV